MPSQSEWESQKNVIRDLYLDQNFTLKALQERMHSIGYIATYVTKTPVVEHRRTDQLSLSKSQYETRLKAWGFSKNDSNIPAVIWKHVGYKIAKRKRDDEDSAVFIDGALIDQKRLKKETSRHSYSTTEKIRLG